MYAHSPRHAPSSSSSSSATPVGATTSTPDSLALRRLHGQRIAASVVEFALEDPECFSLGILDQGESPRRHVDRADERLPAGPCAAPMAASTSATTKYGNQLGGTPGGGSVMPPFVRSPFQITQ